MSSPSQIMAMSPEEIQGKATRGEVTHCVVGLGWMGLPTACLFGEAGWTVIGADSNPRTVERIRSGIAPLEERGLSQVLRRLVQKNQFTATSNVEEAASKSDVISIVVPTGIDHLKRASYTAVEASSIDVSKGLRQGSLVVVQSTCGPLVTERLIKACLEKHSGLKTGADFGLAYSPIRAMSGRALQDIRSYDRIVGGYDARSLEVAATVLSTVVKGKMIKVRDIKTAEAIKLFETIYRDVSIALSNELGMLCEELAIDYIEVMKAANSQPYCHLLIPGMGVGGHCLPVYPYLLASETRRGGAKMKVILESRRVNDDMPRHTLRLIQDGLRVCGKALRGARVAVLGITFRPNVKETRFSPAIELIGLLKRRLARVTVFDPKFVPVELKKMGYEGEGTVREAVEKAECVILAVGHDEFKKLDIIELSAHMVRPGVIVDCTHLMDPIEAERAGLIYRGVGRGLWSK